MVDIISKIKAIRNKPEETRKMILWTMVFICMVIVFGIWIFSFSRTMNNANNWSGLDLDKSPNYGKFTKSFDDLEKEKKEAMKNVTLEVEKAEAVAIAMKYVNESKVLEGIGAKDIKLTKAEKMGGVWLLEYGQIYKNIPVELSDIAISVNIEDKSAKIEKSVYYTGIDLEVVSKLSEAEALEIIKKEIKAESVIAKKSEVVVYTVEGGKEDPVHHLAWKVNVYDEESFFDATYFVDANSGKILSE
ncbi:MAG: PepSY domain-containing protein [Candidatus Paceibacterota bacterium]